MGGREKLTLAMVLFLLANFFAGVKLAERFAAAPLVDEVTALIKTSVDFIQKNTLPGQRMVTVDVKTRLIEDEITLDFETKSITSQKNFTYDLGVAVVRCSVTYLEEERRYLIKCWEE